MHFNENYGRAQAVTKSGKERIQIAFPKQKQGEFTPKIVPVAKTYSKLLHACRHLTIDMCIDFCPFLLYRICRHFTIKNIRDMHK